MGDEYILLDIKHLLGIAEDPDNYFDKDLIIHIGSVLLVLTQLGIGPSNGYSFTGKEKWSDYLGDDLSNLAAVRSYVYLKVRLLFDPPNNGSTMQAIKDLISELEWRLNIVVDPGKAV